MSLAWTMIGPAARGEGREARKRPKTSRRLQPPERTECACGPWSADRNSWGSDGGDQHDLGPVRLGQPRGQRLGDDRRGEILVLQIDAPLARRRSRPGSGAAIPRRRPRRARPARCARWRACVPVDVGGQPSRPGIISSAGESRSTLPPRAFASVRGPESPSAAAPAPSTIAITSCRGGCWRPPSD